MDDDRDRFTALFERHYPDVLRYATRRRGRRHRWTVTAAIVLGVGTLSATADAAGIIPTGVIEALRSAQDPESDWSRGDTAKARRVIEARDGGTRVELWAAPGDKGSECTYLRVVEDGAEPADGSLECGSALPGRLPGEPGLRARFGSLAGDRMGVLGWTARPATAVSVTLPDGRKEVVHEGQM